MYNMKSNKYTRGLCNIDNQCIVQQKILFKLFNTPSDANPEKAIVSGKISRDHKCLKSIVNSFTKQLCQQSA